MDINDAQCPACGEVGPNLGCNRIGCPMKKSSGPAPEVSSAAQPDEDADRGEAARAALDEPGAAPAPQEEADRGEAAGAALDPSSAAPSPVPPVSLLTPPAADAPPEPPEPPSVQSVTSATVRGIFKFASRYPAAEPFTHALRLEFAQAIAAAITEVAADAG